MKHLLCSLAITGLMAGTAQAYDVTYNPTAKSIDSISGIEVNGTSYTVDFTTIEITGAMRPGADGSEYEAFDASQYVTSNVLDNYGGALPSETTGFANALATALNTIEDEYLAELGLSWNSMDSDTYPTVEDTLHVNNGEWSFFLPYTTEEEGTYSTLYFAGPLQDSVYFTQEEWAFTGNVYDGFYPAVEETLTATVAIVTEETPVPVPSSLILLAMGMLTLIGTRKYRMSGNLH